MIISYLTTLLENATSFRDIFDILIREGHIKSNVMPTLSRLVCRRIDRTSEVPLTYADVGECLESCRAWVHSSKGFVLYCQVPKGFGVVAVPLLEVSVLDGVRVIGPQQGDAVLARRFSNFLSGKREFIGKYGHVHGMAVEIVPKLMLQYEGDSHES